MKEKNNTICIITAWLVVLSVHAILTVVTHNKEKGAELYWDCFSTDGRINWVTVKSDTKPRFLPSPGNEGEDFFCYVDDVIDLDNYKRNK